jgi:ABC-type glycerol-3-phosphate transport system substrate-binding protein
MHRKLWKTFNFVIVGILIFSLAGCAVPATAPSAPAAAEPAPAAAAGLDACKGQSLVLGSMTDQYVAAFRVLSPQFEERRAPTVTLDELGYVDLYQKLIADFVGQTGNYDLMTVDIVWSGEFGQNEYTLAARRIHGARRGGTAARRHLAGGVDAGRMAGAHVAYPLAGYANVLNYRKDLLEAGRHRAADDAGRTAGCRAGADRCRRRRLWHGAAGRQRLGGGAGLHGVGAAAWRSHPG